MTDLALGPCPVLVERDRELTELSAIAATVAQGSARLVLITGEAGVGKTRLWSEFADTLPDGWQFDFVGGQHTDRSYEAPFEGFVDEVSARGDPARALGVELARALKRSDHTGPRLFVVEDLHFIDPVAVGALHHALGELRSEQLLVIASYRLGSHPLGSPHSRAVADLLRHPAANETRLPPLSVAGVAEMVAAIGTSADVAELYDRTEGNPFFVEEMARSGGGPLPWTVRESVNARLENLTPETQWLAEVLAVAGSAVPRQVIDELDKTGSSAQELVGVMLALEFDNRIRLRHALVGDALTSRLSEPERRQRHRRLAMAFDAVGDAPLQDLAHHWAAAGELERAAPLAAEAGDRLNGQRSHHTAVELYRTALAHPPSEPAQRAALLERAAAAAAFAGFDDLASAWGAGARAAEDAGGSQWVASGTFGNPIFQRLVRQSVDVEDATVEQISKQVIEAQGLVKTGRFASAIAMAEAAMEAAADAGDRALEADAALIICYAGEVDRGAAELERIAKESEANDDLINATNALGRRARIGMAQGNMAVGLDFAIDALVMGRRAGGPDFWASMQMGAAYYRAQRGELAEAQHLCDEMVALELPLVTEMAYAPLILVAIQRNDLAAAQERLDQLLPVVRALDVDYFSMPVLLIAARVALLAGSPTDAADLFSEAESLIWSPVQELMVEIVLVGVEVGQAIGDHDRLAAAAVRAADLARSVDGPAMRAAADVASAALAAFEGRQREAAALLQQAIPLWERTPRWPAAADSWCDLAEARMASRDGDPLAALASADAIAARCGLGRIRVRIAGLRAAMEAASNDEAGVDSLAGLSDRERQIAALVASGMTNREIGDELYLSEKTVRNYLSRIFDSVGVKRRGELAALVPQVTDTE